MMLAHPQEYLIFGTDSPWTGQKESVEQLLALNLGAERERHILYENARRLLAEKGSGSFSAQHPQGAFGGKGA
jgi:predicted TIM-barrel fold metal-dependent hydrolase